MSRSARVSEWLDIGDWPCSRQIDQARFRLIRAEAMHPKPINPKFLLV